MSEDGLFLVNNLRGLVSSDSHGSVALSGEYNLLSEGARVFDENGAFGSTGEVEELVAVKHTELRTVGARDELLVHLPGDGAVVAVLRDTLFEI